MAQASSHIDLVFTRSIRIQRAHIANEPSARLGEDLMRIAEKGKNALVEKSIAADLMIAGSAILNNKANADAIEAIRKEATEETERYNNQLKTEREIAAKKKAA